MSAFMNQLSFDEQEGWGYIQCNDILIVLVIRVRGTVTDVIDCKPLKFHSDVAVCGIVQKDFISTHCLVIIKTNLNCKWDSIQSM